MKFEFLKITPHIVVHQIFELQTFGLEIQCSSTELSWDLYVKGVDNVFIIIYLCMETQHYCLLTGGAVKIKSGPLWF